MEILLFVLLGVCLYFLPALVAQRNGHKNQGPILVVNLFLGWTLLGWVVALAWAVAAQERKS